MDAVLTDASRSILDVGIVGAVCIILMFVLAFRERTHTAALKEAREELHREQEAHRKTTEARLADIKEYAEIGESIRDQMKSVVMIVQSAIDLMKERGRP